MNRRPNLVEDPGFSELKRFVIQTTGLTYYQDKDEDLGQRLSRRFEALGVVTCRDYLDRLRGGDALNPEFERLAAELTIGETYFFRHEEQFDDLRTTILPELIRRNQSSRRLHVWCAGCSIGAEPYSLAILLDEHFATDLAGWDVRIVATDINRDFLAKATRGVFDEWAFRTTKPEFRQRHFTPAGKAWAIKPGYQRHVEFRYHNLITHPWSSPSLSGSFELIICRNVMIYFDALTNAKVTAFFEQSLVTEGWLVLGHAEMAQGLGQLELKQLPRVTAYRKAPPVVEAPRSTEGDPRPTRPPATGATAPPRSHEDQAAYIRALANVGELDLARASATELIDRDPTNAVALYYRALVLMQLGRAAEAEDDLLRATAVEPSFVMAHYQAAAVIERRGDYAAAGRARARALELLSLLDDEAALPEGDDLLAKDLKELITKRKAVA